jgi:hypothetical protein
MGVVGTPRAKDLTGQTFHRLTVIGRQGLDGNRVATWQVRCVCGSERVVRTSALTRGTTKSCGCLRLEAALRQNSKHGLAKSREYKIWTSMKQRCFTPTCHAYADYGGRGIVVCEEWAASFEKFISDMGPRPDGSFSIERLNNEGHYEPGNCAWVRKVDQQNNTRRNVKLTFEGKTFSVSQWERLLGFGRGTLKWRLARGWSVDRALSEPLVPTNTHVKRVAL